MTSGSGENGLSMDYQNVMGVASTSTTDRHG
jgi:hypothetical protein